MSNNYISIYNNLIHLTRNKSLFSKIGDSETFSYRLILFLVSNTKVTSRFVGSFLNKSYKTVAEVVVLPSLSIFKSEI